MIPVWFVLFTFLPSPPIQDYHNLASEKFAVRYRAEKTIRNAWPQSLTTLAAAFQDKDAHVSMIADRLLDRLCRQQIESLDYAPRADTMIQQIPALQAAMESELARQPFTWQASWPVDVPAWDNDAERAAVRSWASQLLRSGWSKTYIKTLFSIIRQTEYISP